MSESATLRNAVAYVTDGNSDDVYRLRAAILSAIRAGTAPGDVFVFHCGEAPPELGPGVNTVDVSETFSRVYHRPLDTPFYKGCLWPPIVFARFLIPLELRRRGYRRALYLDTDTRVVGGLSDLWEVDLAGAPVGAVADKNQKYCVRKLSSYGCPVKYVGRPYYNSGVLLMECSEADQILQTSVDGMELCLRYGFHMPDQDALNLLFSVCRLPDRFNVFYMAEQSFSGDGAAIVHYTGTDRKNDMAPYIVEADFIRQGRASGCEPTRVVSLTTHGPRTALVGRILDRVCRQADGAGASVVLTLHQSDVPLLAPDTLELVRSRRVTLLKSGVDLGSNLKYYAAMLAFGAASVVVQDDDVVFTDGTFERLFEACERLNRSQPTIVCRRARRMSWSGNAWPCNFGPAYETVEPQNAADCTPVPVHDAFPEGCRGIAFPPGCFRGLLVDDACIADIVNECFHDDDVMIALMAMRAGLRICVLPSPGRSTSVDYYTSKSDPSYVHDKTIEDTSLWKDGRNGRRTTRCLRHFARELWFYGHLSNRLRSGYSPYMNLSNSGLPKA